MWITRYIDNCYAGCSIRSMNSKSEGTFRINGQDKTFAQLTTDEKVQLLRESMNRPQVVSFGRTPPGGWTDADRVPSK